MKDLFDMYSHELIVRDLRTCVAEVTFTKVNGDTRVMRCTLKPDLLPPEYLAEEADEKRFHAMNNKTVRAWDVQINEWRSFRVESVSYFQVIDSY